MEGSPCSRGCSGILGSDAPCVVRPWILLWGEIGAPKLPIWHDLDVARPIIIVALGSLITV